MRRGWGRGLAWGIEGGFFLYIQFTLLNLHYSNSILFLITFYSFQTLVADVPPFTSNLALVFLGIEWNEFDQV